jgi:integrase
MSSAWVYQDDKQVKKHGEGAASWYVGWLDPEGKRRCKSCGPCERGKRTAERLRRQVEAELMTGTYKSQLNTAWQDFRKDFEAKILPGLSLATRYEVTGALDHFQRIVKPAKVAHLATPHVDQYVAARRTERGKLKGSRVSPATINKELRHLKAVLGVAREWGHLPSLPKFRMERVPRKLAVYVTPEHFAELYRACDAAREPSGLPYPAADWWRGLLVTAYMTGWRIGALLSLRRDDLDLEAGTALSRAEDNKGKRDAKTPLHPIVVEHLRKLPVFTPAVFPWYHARRRLYVVLDAIQEAAGVRPDGRGRYGFHDLRRAFATMNADKLTPDALQALMQHKSYQTTQGYINMARQLNPAVAGLYVPQLPGNASMSAH